MSAVAVVSLARGRHRHLAAQHASLVRGTLIPEHYVVAAMADPAITPITGWPLGREVLPVADTGAGLPLARARNLAVEHAIERGAEVVIALDVDCLAGPGLVAGYLDAVRADPEAVWSGPVTYLPPPAPAGYPIDRLDDLDDPHPARPAPAPGELRLGADPRLFWSLSFAMSADAWRRTGGFCEDYVGYGGEDTDFACLAERAGLRFGWAGSARAYHQHHPVSDPPVEHVADIVRNAELFHRRWGWWPMEGWLRAFEERGLVRRDGGRWRLAQSGTTVERDRRHDPIAPPS